ncbi:Nuclear control of ATPase protein 2 [Zalaria obscura]|uniref:Nuclear control of ATPase protein 2 n=1 Tax=Zalaria obscura TaxID=2024903 RepID=A0ACC3S351_9PEZI
MQKRVVGPVARVRSEVRVKQNKLKRMRVRGANALGVLLGEGMVNESIHGEGLATPSEQSGPHKWKASVARNVALVEAVLGRVHEEGLGVDKFDSAIAESTDEDPLYEVEFWSEGDKTRCSVQPAQVAERLHQLLTVRLPAYNASSTALVQQHGRPSRLVRYWLPLTVGILSSSTILRILVNRKAEIIQWITELGATIVDFWANWVVEPTRKVIATIRHDEGSEVSIMSRKSLEGDRASLERMVVDFAVANPETSTGTTAPLTEPQIAEIRTAVREGDLTPVLRAYEKDLASPLMGTVRGNLIRALLIQIQKTKVDVEVAMGGIDALLKSQELVFGFVGLTPGILVTLSLYRWLGASMSRKSGEKKGRDRGLMIRQLRNIDRVLANARPTEFGELFYRDQGLLLCEVHVLGREAARSMPDQVRREFAEEVEELVDVRSGVERQRRVVERIRWAYGRWF